MSLRGHSVAKRVLGIGGVGVHSRGGGIMEVLAWVKVNDVGFKILDRGCEIGLVKNTVEGRY